MNDLTLQQFEAKDFMGINQDAPVIIDFTKTRGKNAVIFSGDQGTKKTSTMNALMYLMGANFNVDVKNFFNQKDNAVDVTLAFGHDGDDYLITANGTRFVLKRKFKDRWVSESEPKTTLKRIFGNIGVSPMHLKDKSGKEQIKWVKETFGVEEDASKKEVKITGSLRELESTRRDVNREIKTLKGALDAEPLYNDYENSLKRFKESPSAKKEKERYDELTELNRKWELGKSEVTRLTTDLSVKTNEIAELEKKLALLKKSAEDIGDRIEKGKKWLVENKDVPKEFEKATEAWINLSKTLAEYDKWKTILKREKEYNDCLDAVNVANDRIDKLRKELLSLTSTYLPKVPGLEIRVRVGLDDEDEGIYYNNKSLAQLSESEIWDLFADHIWPEKDVYFIFCENITSLGSEAIKNMNRLVKEKKAMIFATEMDRSKDELNITITTKLS